MSRRSYMSMYDSDTDDEGSHLLNNANVQKDKTVIVEKPRQENGNPPPYQSPQVLAERVTPSMSVGYEEFFRDSVPCPTCRGSGRIHKDEEKKLVAIIPLTDKRLKPRRTYVYILITVLLCVLIGAFLLFFLIPRSVHVFSDSPMLFATSRHFTYNPDTTNLTVTNCYNFSNLNYYAIQLDGMEVTTQMKRDLTQVGQGKNKTQFNVGVRSRFEYCVNMTVLFKGDASYVILFCQSKFAYEHILAMEFKLTANYTVLGQSLQTTLMTFQYLDCGNGTDVDTGKFGILTEPPPIEL